ncbi:Protein kinase [Sulfidibacter corallicola]|uniref:non-specific serine/threonine protein kinase n=1 Tax=Sulfidibacter corallicola TaxID=2818388 RepID=A0A8A4TT10_SULCO|nr:serine/threonine-protein kinase [Sulfidibacter corallicola]QTD52191.1 protein kinase [Sulfidibacter corallicola]
MSTVTEPEKLLHYDILEVLGSGGNGTVYRAVDTRNEKVVALKTLKTVTEVTLNRFKREYLALKKMDNDGIVKVFEGFFEHAPPFFSMEWVRGKTLSNVIEDMEHNPLIFSVADRENFAVRLAIQACDILSYIHDFQEVHRDLKPDNLFITMDKGNILSEFHVKMLDFGLLKQLSTQEDEDTQSGMIVGTVHYLSPEQARGTSLDPRSDLYSLGVIMYRIISLKLPYEAKDVVGYIFKTVFEDPIPIDQHTQECSKQMQSILHDLLAKEPGKRPPTANALKSRLKGLLQKEVKTVDFDASDLDFTSGIEGWGTPLLPPPLIGRDEAIAKLERLIQTLDSTHPQAALVIGEPGMGRTSVLKEWRSRVQFKEPIFMQVHFAEEAVPAQDPVGTLMDSLIRNMKPEEVKTVFRDVYPFLSSVSRYLGRYFDTKSVSKFDHLSPGRKLQVLAINFIKLIQTLTVRGPIVILLDNAQNAPERFYGWLTLFWEQVGSKKLLLLLSASPDHSKKAYNQFVARLKSGPDMTEIPLNPLEEKQICDLLQDMLPIATRLPFSEKLRKFLMERGSGNPFYSIELFSRLYEDDHVFINKGTIDVRSVDDLDVPVSIHQALMKKVSRQPEDAITLLRAASIVGNGVDYATLQNMLGWQEEKVIEEVMSLLKQGILSESEEGTNKLNFNAPALLKIVTEQMSEEDKRFWHHAAARAIEKGLPTNDILTLEKVAYHYANSANHVRAVKYAYLAGNSSLEAKDMDKAVYFYELSLEMMDRMENKQARNLVNLKLAEVHLSGNQPREAISYYNESLKIPNLSKMEELRSLRGRMLCFQKLDQLEDAFGDARALFKLGETCSARIRSETKRAFGRLSWQFKGEGNVYFKELDEGRKIYPKLKHWQLELPLSQMLANEVIAAGKRLLAQLKSNPPNTFPLYCQLAFIRYFMGDFNKAREYLNAAQNATSTQQHQGGPHFLVLQALLTYKIKNTLAPDHTSDEYLVIAERYLERFGLEKLHPVIAIVRLEHLLMNGRYEEAWELIRTRAKDSMDLPVNYHDRYLFLSLAMRAAWEMKERPPRGWLIQFQKFNPAPHDSFILQTHWVLARATEASLPLSMGAPKALKSLKEVEALLVQAKLKYYYRAVLTKQIILLENLDQQETLAQLITLRNQIDDLLKVALPER